MCSVFIFSSSSEAPHKIESPTSGDLFFSDLNQFLSSDRNSDIDDDCSSLLASPEKISTMPRDEPKPIFQKSASRESEADSMRSVSLEHSESEMSSKNNISDQDEFNERSDDLTSEKQKSSQIGSSHSSSDESEETEKKKMKKVKKKCVLPSE